MLQEQSFFGDIDKVNTAIERLQSFQPPEGYYLAFSGGKDSVAIKALADLAKVKYTAHYSKTYIDPPELVHFIREHHKDVQVDIPPVPFLDLLSKKGYPCRRSRWCCAEYKERFGSGSTIVTGIRWAESSRRAKRRMVEFCYRDTTKKYVNPIIDWTDKDVWAFIKSYKIPYCSLYDKGRKRIGCLFCPMASNKERKRDVVDYPKFKDMFVRAFDKLIQNKLAAGNTNYTRWKTGQELFDYWLSAKHLPYNKDQLPLFP